MSFYKFTDQRVLDAHKHHLEDKEAVYQEATAFALLFGEGGTCYYTSRPQFEFAGIKFKPRKDTTLWSIPTKQNAGFQRPRGSAQGMTPEQRAERLELRRRWDASYPKLKHTIKPVFDAMGFDWDWMQGYLLFGLDGVLYFQTDGKPTLGIEILGSEFALAHEKATA